MKVQVLVSAMHADGRELAEKMHLESDAVIINQCDREGKEVFLRNGREIRCLSFKQRGVGNSRNHGIEEADRDICLFSDEDIVYKSGYEKRILREFKRNPKADMIVFNIEIEEERKTYHITERKRVHFYNCGRYGAVSFALRTAKLKESGVRFSTLFGGGAKYSAGEDSLFIKDFMDRGYRVYTAPVTIGREEAGDSSWFTGYHEKFFFDRGVLYAFLYGAWAPFMALRFLLAHRKKLCGELSVKAAFLQMRKGIAKGKQEQKA